MGRQCPVLATYGPLATTASSAGTPWIRRPMTRCSLETRPPPFSRIPPYNVRVQGHVSGKGVKKHREFPMAAGELTEDAFRRFLADAFGLMVSHSVEGATFFACMDWRHLLEIVNAIQALGCELLNLCVWIKTNGGMGSLYRSRHELVFVFGKRDATRVNNVQLGRHGRNRTNVWNYPGMNSFARRGRTRGLDLHPTVKPIAMVSDAILDVTTRGDIVLDPFCGSGTTILAAERTGRRGYAIELDPGHVDTAIARWERMTKRTARSSKQQDLRGNTRGTTTRRRWDVRAVESGSNKPPVKRGAHRARGRRRRWPARQESTLEITDRLLTRRVPISVSGQATRLSATEAIVLHLIQKAMSGNPRAWRALLKYQEYANSRSDRSTEVRFIESDYTRAVAKSHSRSGDG